MRVATFCFGVLALGAAVSCALNPPDSLSWALAQAVSGFLWASVGTRAVLAAVLPDRDDDSDE